MNDVVVVENLAKAGLRVRRRRDVLRPFAATVAAAALPARAQPRGPAKPPLKVGFVYVSPVSDAGWTYQHDLGRRELEQTLGARVTVRAVEKVAEGADAERVLRDLATQGHGLVFATSFGYMDPTIKVARDFPEVAFEHASGYRTAANVATYDARYYEGRWLAGLVAGRSTRSSVLGYVAAFPIPEVLQGLNAFTLGARAVNPAATVRVVWTNAWFDPGRERDAAFTLVNQGADVLSHHTDSSAVPQAAQARGVRVVGYHSDMSRVAPRAHLVSVTHHWGRHYVARAQAVLEGRWGTGASWGGLADGRVRLEALAADLPAPTVALLQSRQSELVAGRLHPFAGPLRDNEGRTRGAQGATPSPADLATMDWLVEGVVGRLPKG